MIYDCFQYNTEKPFKVELKETKKQITITPLDDRPTFTYGCIDDLWRNGKIVVKKDLGEHRIPRHLLNKIGEDTYVFYPQRAGIPYLLKKV